MAFNERHLQCLLYQYLAHQRLSLNLARNLANEPQDPVTDGLYIRRNRTKGATNSPMPITTRKPNMRFG